MTDRQRDPSPHRFRPNLESPEYNEIECTSEDRPLMLALQALARCRGYSPSLQRDFVRDALRLERRLFDEMLSTDDLSRRPQSDGQSLT